MRAVLPSAAPCGRRGCGLRGCLHVVVIRALPVLALGAIRLVPRPHDRGRGGTSTDAWLMAVNAQRSSAKCRPIPVGALGQGGLMFHVKRRVVAGWTPSYLAGQSRTLHRAGMRRTLHRAGMRRTLHRPGMRRVFHWAGVGRTSRRPDLRTSYPGAKLPTSHKAASHWPACSGRLALGEICTARMRLWVGQDARALTARRREVGKCAGPSGVQPRWATPTGRAAMVHRRVCRGGEPTA
jgi:hypothetical protein